MTFHRNGKTIIVEGIIIMYIIMDHYQCRENGISFIEKQKDWIIRQNALNAKNVIFLC